MVASSCLSLARSFLALLLACLLLPLSTLAQVTTSTGAVEGRVFNAATGSALANVRVSIAGTSREAVTDSAGSFRIASVPTGEVRLTVEYVGFRSEAATLQVAPAGTARRDFELSLAHTAPVVGETVQLSQFTVVADREMSAQAIAMNEQRAAPNLKNVVAIDEFGDRGNENIGEFLLFLPGVSIETSGTEPNSVALRGFPGSNTGLTIDGADVAGARNNNSRTVDLREVPMNNISRVEITKVPTPDMPATGLGGSINLISRSGFEAKSPRLSYNVYTLFHDRNGITFDGGERNHVPGTTAKYIQPSFDLSYLKPINRNFALTVGLSRTWRQKPMETGDTTDETAEWNLVDGFQRTSQWNSLAQTTRTFSGQLGVDWRISEKDTLTASLQYRDYQLYTTRSVLLWNYGAGATGNASFVQGAATGVGTVTMQAGPDSLPRNNTIHSTLKYRHRGDVWRIDATGSYSAASSETLDVNRGHFYQTTATISNLVIRGDGIPAGDGILPTRYTAVSRTAQPVDLYDGGNYSIVNTMSDQGESDTARMNGRLDFGRDIGIAAVKVGVSIDRTERDERRFTKQWNFRPNGATDVTARLAGNFDVFDQAFNDNGPTVYGQRARWLSDAKVYQLFLDNPSWFVLDEPLAHQSAVNNSRKFAETVSAAYLRTDLRLLSNRLWLVAGVRFERTDTAGDGPLNDINAQYQRNPDGTFVRNGAGQRVFITAAPLAQRKLRFQERAAHASRTYDDFYPSLNATYDLSDKLVLRAAYARTLGRPNLSFIAPGLTISEPDVVTPTITVNNTGLEPWTADSFDLALESYHLKDGFGSIGVFHKSIKNFFGVLNTPATPDLLEQYGLGEDPTFANYTIATRINAGDATIRGFEFGYRQSLTFLPQWARGLQVFVNATKLELSGSNTADFSSFNPETLAGGINLIRERFSVKFTYSYLGETRRGLVAVNAANGIPADTYNYQGKRTRLGVNAQYSLSRRYSLYASVSDLGGFVQDLRRYAPSTPEYARSQRRQELGFYTTFGVRGSF